MLLKETVDEEMLTTTTANTSTTPSSSHKASYYHHHRHHSNNNSNNNIRQEDRLNDRRYNHNNYSHYNGEYGCEQEEQQNGHYVVDGDEDEDDSSFSSDSDSSGSCIVYEVDEELNNNNNEENDEYPVVSSSSPQLACHENDSMYNNTTTVAPPSNYLNHSSLSRRRGRHHHHYEEEEEEEEAFLRDYSRRNQTCKFQNGFQNSNYQEESYNDPSLYAVETMERHTTTRDTNNSNMHQIDDNDDNAVMEKTQQLQQRLMAMALSEKQAQQQQQQQQQQHSRQPQPPPQPQQYEYNIDSVEDDIYRHNPISYEKEAEEEGFIQRSSSKSLSRESSQTSRIKNNHAFHLDNDDDDNDDDDQEEEENNNNNNNEHPASLRVAPPTIFRRVRHHKHHQQRNSARSNTMNSTNSYSSGGSSTNNSTQTNGRSCRSRCSRHQNDSRAPRRQDENSQQQLITSPSRSIHKKQQQQHGNSQQQQQQQVPRSYPRLSRTSSDYEEEDNYQNLPIASNLIDPSHMFDNLVEHGEADQALKANAKLVKDLKEGKGQSSTVTRKRRPKLKNLTRDLKKESRRQRSHIKGKVIDGQHEQYALSIGMMLGIRVAVWGRYNEEGGNGGEEKRKQREIREKLDLDNREGGGGAVGGGNGGGGGGEGDQGVNSSSTKTGKTLPSCSTITESGAEGIGGGGGGIGLLLPPMNSISTLPASLCIDDCMRVEDYVFPPEGNQVPPHITPPHKLGHTFKFRAYAPDMFSYIRTLLGVDKEHFLLSLSGEYNFIEFISNAKSGQFFFYSHDGRYVIKTQTAGESKFLRRILPHYVQYMSNNPNNFLTHFYGMYRVKMKHLRRNMHFVIMRSVFNTEKEIHKIWDLKGSKQGRFAKEGETVHKDLDIQNEGRKLTVGPEKKRLILDQLAKDASFLAGLKIMDYSLLLGVHNREEARGLFQSSSNLQKRKTGSGDIGNTRSKTPLRNRNNHKKMAAENKQTDEMSDISSHSSKGDVSYDRVKNQVFDGVDEAFASDEDLDEENDNGYDSSDSEAAHSVTVDLLADCAASRAAAYHDDDGGDVHDDEELISENETVNPMTDRKDLGIQSLTLDAETMRSKEIYFFGIIDILQQYNTKKMAETVVKRSRTKHSDISCVDPKMYANRFIQFCASIIE